MNTGRFIKQAISKDNSVEQKNKRSNGAYELSTINQLLVQSLRPTLLSQYFQGRYFLVLSAITQCLFLFVLQRLEQSSLFNGAD